MATINDVRDMRAILNQLNDTDDYRAVVEAGGGLTSEWWKLIRGAAGIHPDSGIADILFAALRGRGNVDAAVVDDVKEMLSRMGVRSLTTVATAISRFNAFSRGVQSKLSRTDGGFIKECENKNKDHVELNSSEIVKILENMRAVLDALVNLFS